MKTKLVIIAITSFVTALVIFVFLYFLLGLNNLPRTALSLDSPDGLYKAYVTDEPAFDPPNQCLWISKIGSNGFRLVDDLPEDIEKCKNIYWAPDSKTVVFATNWHLLITHIESFNTQKISINPDWWKTNDNGTFTSSNRWAQVEELTFIGNDSISFKTDLMENPERLSLKQQ
jgi:hypothetical protein